MLLKKYSIVLSVFILLFTTHIFANIDEARNRYKNGDIVESLELYNKWLKANHESENFTNILFELSELNGDIFTITSILNEQVIFIDNREQKKDLYVTIAQLFELSSNLHDAQINYQKASLSLLDEIDYNLLLKSAKILLLQGDLFLAESQLKEIITNSLNTNIIFEAELFYTIFKILHSHENKNIVYQTIDEPEYLYVVYLVAKANSDQEQMESIKKKIIKDFESSPEAALLREEIHELPDILTSLGLLAIADDSFSSEIVVAEDQLQSNGYYYMIQTGSFRDKENAQYLSKDLIAAGFSAVVETQIINNISYHKVLLYFSTEEQITKTLKTLKEKGFEGFPVY